MFQFAARFEFGRGPLLLQKSTFLRKFNKIQHPGLGFKWDGDLIMGHKDLNLIHTLKIEGAFKNLSRRNIFDEIKA